MGHFFLCPLFFKKYGYSILKNTDTRFDFNKQGILVSLLRIESALFSWSFLFPFILKDTTKKADSKSLGPLRDTKKAVIKIFDCIPWDTKSSFYPMRVSFGGIKAAHTAFFVSLKGPRLFESASKRNAHRGKEKTSKGYVS